MKTILSVFFLKWPYAPQTREHHKALVELAKWSYKFSPIIAFDNPPCTELSASSTQEDSRFIGLNIDLTGTERLFKHQTLLEQFLAFFVQQNLLAKIAIAPTLGSAWAYSRYGLEQCHIITPQTLVETISPLPVQGLRIGRSTALALKELHITHIKHLLKIPRASLASRFSIELSNLLDCALGSKQEPLAALSFRPMLRAAKIFDAPVPQLETVSLTVHILLKQLLSQLHGRQEKAARLILKIKANGLPPTTKIITLSIPSNKEKHLWSLLQPHLETVQLGHGVETIGLAITQISPLRAQSQSYLREHQMADDSRYGELIDTCIQHLGEENVRQVEPCASYIPELSFRYRPTTEPSPQNAPPFLTVERPSLLFYRPQLIHAMALLPDNPPFWLKWQGTKFAISNSFGPERIAPEWWGKDEKLCLTRDYFRVQLTTGLWLWIFRELETSRWFVHGVWA